jgi:multiple sugar transport system permease protein
MTAASRASLAPRSAGRSRGAGGHGPRRGDKGGGRGGGRGGDLGRTGFALYLTGGTIAALIFLLPLAWAVLRSFMPNTLVTQAPSAGDFSHLTTANYSGVISTNDILRYAANSLAVAVGTGLLTAVIATMAGYGFARFRFRGSGLVFALVLVTMMIPFQALLTPLFLEMHSLGLTNNLAGLALFYTTFNLPFGVFVMRNTFLQIPWELSEAAAVDGASMLRTLVSVLRPLIVPGIATTVLYAFLFSWTEFVGALTFITSDNLFTLPLALLNMEYGSVGQVNFGYLEAGAVIAMVPCVLLYIGLQRFYIRGLVSGVVKG